MKKFPIELVKRAFVGLTLCVLTIAGMTGCSYVKEKNVAIPMRDGVILYANIYKPKNHSGEPLPVLIARTPYGKDALYMGFNGYGEKFTKNGYIFVGQDVRGRFSSEGDFDIFVNEINDGYDTVDWVAKQTWCDGNIGVWGDSYYGYTAWAAVASNHPSIKCAVPGMTTMDWYAMTYFAGAYDLQLSGPWSISMFAQRYQDTDNVNLSHLPLISMDDEAGVPSPFYDDAINHPIRDAYWAKINLHQYYDQVTIPVLHFGGTYDNFLKYTIADWKGVMENSSSQYARENQWLLLPPFDHEHTPENTGRVGKIKVDSNIEEYWTQTMDFYNYFLKGEENNYDQTPKVSIYVLGDNVWRRGNEWPLAGTEFTKYYFHSNGKANTSLGDGALNILPPDEEPNDAYVYDPSDPVDIASGDGFYWETAKKMPDRKRIEKNRDDILVYTTSELTAPVEITGPMSVTLYAASSAVDTDFTATLVDVFPELGGYAQMVQEGIVRASYRESDTNPQEIIPGKVYKYTIDLWATSHVFKAGHKIRVEISSSKFDRFDRNLNTGESGAYSDRMVNATQTIYHSSEYPSHITLPIIPRQ